MQEGWLIILPGPDVVWNLRDGRGNKNGVMWIHGPKGKSQMCQTVADALFLPEDERDCEGLAYIHTLRYGEIGLTLPKSVCQESTQSFLLPPKERHYSIL